MRTKWAVVPIALDVVKETEDHKSVTAANWKVSDFPPPVGMRARQSRPDFVALMISR